MAVLPAEIKQLIGRLDPGSFTALVEGLVSAEAGRLQMPATNLVMSDALTDNDGGLDARLLDVPDELPQGPASALPTGEVGLQLKATKRKNPAAFGLSSELRKPGPKGVIRGGGTYILVTSQDLNPAQRAALESALASEAEAVLLELGVEDVVARTAVWDAQTLAGLCQIHPNPAIEIGLADFGAARSLEELLRSLHADERPFQSDAPRQSAIERLRERAARESDDPLLLWLHGDPGAGKTRTIAEALDADGLRDTVLYVEGAEGLQLLLTRLVRNATSRGILVVDEVDDHTVAGALRSLGGLEGRWRIVAVKSHADRRSVAEGGRNIVLPPLDPDATRRLVEEHAGLPEAQARMVAEVAAGFPELALRLADELRADPDLDLVRLARLPHPAELLERALGDDELRNHLAPIALFAAVGFEDELHYELEAVAIAFGLDPATVERYCDAEVARGRFVSRAGRYRMVSPLLVAIWLASDLIERTARFEDLIFALPESLQEAFVRQLEYFGPEASHLPAAIARVIANERFRRPEAFSEAAGRLLRASAAIVPLQVAEAIGELLDAAKTDDLLRMPRRDVVWALQILLWWPETFERALEGLYLLAQHETETWANNATGELPNAFSLYLSGSTVPYRERAAWLERQIVNASPDQLSLLAKAAKAGLQTHHSRTRIGFRGGGEPTDWQPDSRDEYIESRRTAWRLLVALRDRAEGPTRVDITKELAQSLRVAYGSALAEDVDRDLRSRDWSVDERALLASGLRDVLQYEELDAALRASIQTLHDYLVGEDLTSRLQVIVRTSQWDLHADRETIHDIPPLLVDIADRLAERGDEGIRVALDVGSDLDQQDTRYVLFRLLAQRLGAERIGEAALKRSEWTAVSASLSVADGVGEAAWADRVLKELAESDPERVPELLLFVDLNEQRVDRVLSVIEGGRASGAALGRLLFGARARELDEPQVLRVLRTVAASDRIEPALGMLEQWLETHDAPSAAVSELAGELALRAVSESEATMAEYYVQRLIERGALMPDAMLEVWEARMINRSGLVDELDRALTEKVLEDPEAASPRILDLVRRARVESSFGLYVSADLALLSRLAAATSAAEVWTELETLPDMDLRWALHQMDWTGNEPEPLVREFLLSDRRAAIENEATVCFRNTLGVVSGPYYLALQRELERAHGWRNALAGTSAEAWSTRLIEGYEREIEWQREREAEESLRFR